ncbi:hypothetical protein CAL26_10745 [Bordetella genomosp. 9]|uniref:3-hydroxyisobutyrate dehydrogenase n=1 Tax=Bordetella genomosp. 9 TaxID=1416803 RepID=A0A261RG14_9BORD|nr:hypothetical protein CAL26_10745 [Bordetella genomosp. 9]
MKIGIAGYGTMGSALAARLADTGAAVSIWDRKPERRAAAPYPGHASPAELAKHCDVVISSLFDDHAVKAVYTGGSGLFTGGHGKLFIEMSTVAPATQRALAVEAGKAGAAFAECPVSGSRDPARAGQLLGLAGGSAADVERALPVLRRVCRRVEHLGPIGAGAIAKLAVNLPLLAFWQSLGEALSLIQGLGKDPAWLMDLFGDTAAAPAVLKSKSAAVAGALAGSPDQEPTFQINAMRKDLLLMLAEAESRRVPLPVARAALSAFDEAVADGQGNRDCSAMPAYWTGRAV